MAYQKTWQMKVVKTKHQITFTDHTTVKEMIADLSNLPGDAKFADMEWADEDNGAVFHYMEFNHEAEQPESR